MSRIKLTEEEKATRELAKRQQKIADRIAKNLERQQNWITKVETAKEEILNSMSDVDRRSFIEELKLFNEDSKPYQDIEKSIFNQFKTYGKLSEKQITLIIRKHKEKASLKFVKILFEDYVVGTEYDLILKVISIKEEYFQSIYGNGTSNVVRLESVDGQFFKFCTNNKRLMTKLDNTVNTWIKVSAKVKWISNEGRNIKLNPVGLKIH
jgi:hypothetical protein